MKYLVMTLQCQWLRQGNLPDFLGSTLRGTFGHLLKETVCDNTGVCKDCSRKFQCAYSLAFETPWPENVSWISKYPNAPHPFVFRFPKGGLVKEGQRFQIGLTLFGNVHSLLPPFLKAIYAQGRRGVGRDVVGFQVNGVYGSRGEKVLVPDASGSGTDTIGVTEVPKLSFTPPVGFESAKADFNSPCKLVYRGRPVLSFNAHAVSASILRRLSMMSAYHGSGSPDLDYRAWISSASQSVPLTDNTSSAKIRRFSNRQQSSMEFYGFSGQVTMETCPSSLARLFEIGEVLHVGKATAFGFGHLTYIRNPDQGLEEA
jgi:hypothetical protein